MEREKPVSAAVILDDAAYGDWVHSLFPADFQIESRNVSQILSASGPPLEDRERHFVLIATGAKLTTCDMISALEHSVFVQCVFPEDKPVYGLRYRGRDGQWLITKTFLPYHSFPCDILPVGEDYEVVEVPGNIESRLVTEMNAAWEPVPESLVQQGPTDSSPLSRFARRLGLVSR